MKAIDFACRLLMSMEYSTLPLTRQRVLIAMGAGLETCADIATYCVMSGQQTAAQLLALERSKHIRKTGTDKPYNYQLEQEGKKYLKETFQFLPHQQDH